MTYAVMNRRRIGRLACMLSVQYRTKTHWHPATVQDLSESGCRLRIGEDLPGSAPIDLRFELPIKDGATSPVFEVRGTVMWCRVEGLSHKAGVQFAIADEGLKTLLLALASL